LRMLLMLQRRAQSPLAIRIAAPTGKAAQRLVQALREGKSRLRSHVGAALPDDWLPLLDAIPDNEALTAHRLLGYEPWRNAFRRNARDPIAADVVVVDEASMVDLAMLRSLLDAVRPDATLILVGDADQLTSVATGSVLADLVAALEADPRGDLVRLTHSFRAERELVAVNEAVRAGDAEALASALAASNGRAAHHGVADERALRDRVARWAKNSLQRMCCGSCCLRWLPTRSRSRTNAAPSCAKR
jgi:exodeoxyribonuclease V alpha subunit